MVNQHNFAEILQYFSVSSLEVFTGLLPRIDKGLFVFYERPYGKLICVICNVHIYLQLWNT
jgi:hypothetical protein